MSLSSERTWTGVVLQRGEQIGSTDGIEVWQVADATSFNVRGPDYDTSRAKISSRGAIYRYIYYDTNFTTHPFPCDCAVHAKPIKACPDGVQKRKLDMT